MNSELVLVVPQRSPVNSLKELIALAKAKPGTLNYGSSGPGSNYHMAGELIKNLAGLDIVHVPYKGSTGARADIVSGQIDMMFDSVPTMALDDRETAASRRSARPARCARRSCRMSRPSRKPEFRATTQQSGSA